MLKNLPTLQRYLPMSKPWVSVAAVLAVVLLLGYAFLGMQYWKFSGEDASLTSQINELQAADRADPSQEDALVETLEPLEQHLEELRGWFTFPEVDDLVVTLEAAAWEAQVHLLTVSVGEVFQQSFERTRYEAQPIRIELRAGTADTQRFLSVLQRELPMADLSDISLKGIEGDPLVGIDLLFYGSPEVISDDEEAS